MEILKGEEKPNIWHCQPTEDPFTWRNSLQVLESKEPLNSFISPPPANLSEVETIPREILCLSFSYVHDLVDICHITLTCKLWNLLAWNCVKSLSLTLRKKEPWSCIRQMDRIRSLEIDAGNAAGCLSQMNVDEVIGTRYSLKKLCIERACKNLQFHLLKDLEKLTCLSLYDCLNICNICFLSEMPCLKKLCLSKCVVGDSGMEVLAKITSLKSLYLWHTHISNNGVKFLEGLTKLEVLDISGNPNVSDICLTSFVGLKELRLLDTSNTLVSIDGLFKLKEDLPLVQIGYKELYGNPLMQRTRKLKLF